MKVQRRIYCPGPERWVSLGRYVQAVRRAKTHLDSEFKQGITCWWPCTGRDILAQFHEGMMDRINQAIPYSARASQR